MPYLKKQKILALDGYRLIPTRACRAGDRFFAASINISSSIAFQILMGRFRTEKVTETG